MSNQDYSIDDFFTEENIVLPEVIVEYPIEDIKGYSDDVYKTHYHVSQVNGETFFGFR